MPKETYKVEFCYGYFILAEDKEQAVENAQNQHNIRLQETPIASPAEVADGVHVTKESEA